MSFRQKTYSNEQCQVSLLESFLQTLLWIHFRYVTVYYHSNNERYNSQLLGIRFILFKPEWHTIVLNIELRQFQYILDASYMICAGLGRKLPKKAIIIYRSTCNASTKSMLNTPSRFGLGFGKSSSITARVGSVEYSPLHFNYLA